MHNREVATEKELRKTSRTLIKLNTPPTNYILQKYEIKKADLLTGIHCPICEYLPLKREKRKWYCPSCQTYYKDAHIQSLQDYFLIFDSHITNEKFREFSDHPVSPQTATRLLKLDNLKTSGTNKGTVYFLDSLPIQDE